MATVEQIRRLSVTGTTTGLDKMASDLNKVGAAQESVAQTAAKVEAETKRSTGTVINAQAAFDRLSRSIDPIAKAQAALDRATRLGTQAMQQNTGAVEQHQRNIAILQQRLEDARQSADRFQASLSKVQSIPQRPMDRSLQQGIDSRLGIGGGGQGRGEDVAAFGRQLDALRAKYNPLFAAGQTYRERLAEIKEAHQVGALSANEYATAIARSKADFASQVTAMKGAAVAGRENAQAIGLQRYQLTNLSFQLNDAATMLLSGSSVFQIMATQGGQVYQVLQQGPQGVGGSVKQLGSMLMGLITPARLAMGAVAGIGIAGAAAWNSWDNKIKDAQRSLNQLGRGTGLTTQSLTGIADRAAQGGSLSVANAMGGASQFAGAGIFGDVIERLLPLSRQFAGATGLSIAESQKELSSIASPSKGLDDLAKRFGPFGFEVEQNVRRLEALGRLQEAQIAVTDALSKRLRDTTDTTGIFAKALEGASGLLSRGWSFLGKVGAPQSLEDQLSTLEGNRAQTDPRNRGRLAGFDKEIEALRRQLQDREQKAASDRAAAEQQRLAGIERQNRSIIEGGELGARGILARSGSERLAIEQERILKEARLDSAKAATQAAESEKARTMALAEANRALRDYQRNSRDEAFMGGAMTEVERFRRQTQIEQRDLRERTDVLRDGGAGGAGGGAIAGAQGLATDFRTKLEALIAAIPGISITSGFRTNAEQARLFAEKPHLAAPPGRSNHEFGLAADLRFASPDARAEAHRRAGEFGMRFPMGHEPWHIEPIGARAMRGGAQPLTIRPTSGDAPGPVDGARVSAFTDSLAKRLFHDTEQQAQAASRALDASAAGFGRSTYEIARQNEVVRLENDLRRSGVEVTSQHVEKILQLADAEGRLAKRREEVAESQRRQIAAMDEVRSTTSDLISSPLKALARGESASDALRQVGLRAGEKMIDAGSRGISEMFFGKQGKPGGGIFGDLLGDLMGSGPTTTANMTVTAGNVVVSGGLGGGGGGGILGSLFSGGSEKIGLGGVFGGLYANGAAFRNGNVVPFASGGVVNSATHFPMSGGRTGVMGEAGAEGIMPLQRDRSGKLGVIVAGRAREQARQHAPSMNYRGGDTIIQGNVTEDVMPRLKAELDKRDAKQRRDLQRNFGNYQRVNEEDKV